MPRSTSLPRPPAPIIEAITTMDSASIIVWLTPAMIEGSAIGSCTRTSSCRGVQPNATPASTISGSTLRIPSAVRRTAGGIAKMIVAIVPGTLPRPKNIAAGIR